MSSRLNFLQLKVLLEDAAISYTGKIFPKFNTRLPVHMCEATMIYIVKLHGG